MFCLTLISGSFDDVTWCFVFVRDHSQYDSNTAYQPPAVSLGNQPSDYPDNQSLAYAGHQQQAPSHDNYAAYSTLTSQANGSGGALNDQFAQMHMDPERYSDRGDSMRYNPDRGDSMRYEPDCNAYSDDRANTGNFEPPLNDSYSAQGSGYYGDPAQNHDPYGNRHDLGYGQAPYGDNRSQSPPSERGACILTVANDNIQCKLYLV